MYRLAAFDMDGTLLMPDHRVGPETLAVLNQLVEREMVVTFATGRHYLDAQPIMAQLGLQGYLITGNGTRVYDNRGQQLHATDLPAAVAEEVLHHHWRTRASMHVFRDEGWLTEFPVPEEMLRAHHLSGFRFQLPMCAVCRRSATARCALSRHMRSCWRCRCSCGRNWAMRQTCAFPPTTVWRCCRSVATKARRWSG